MSGQDQRAADSHFTKWMESITPLEENPEIVQLSAARSRAAEEASATIARQLNGPLTALLLYMNEIKQHSHQFSQAPGNRLYLQQVVENALQQTERVCALVKQISDNHPAAALDAGGKQTSEAQARHPADGARTPGQMFARQSGPQPPPFVPGEDAVVGARDPARKKVGRRFSGLDDKFARRVEGRVRVRSEGVGLGSPGRLVIAPAPGAHPFFPPTAGRCLPPADPA